MKPKLCHYCEQTIDFERFDQHINYCGSRTKKCDECGHNVCLKDLDGHKFGGECEAFKEDDIRKRLEEKKKKEQEEKKRQEDLKRYEAKRKERERNFEDNFAMDELDNERGGGISEKLPK